MGRRGPAPKRSGEGHRTTQARAEKRGITKAAGFDGDYTPPPADPEWHPIAKDLYEAAKVSGQTRFYQPSDWAILYTLCDDVSWYKLQPRRSATMLAAFSSLMSNLLLNEADRRRVGIELHKPTEAELETAGVSSMQSWAAKRAAT